MNWALGFPRLSQGSPQQSPRRLVLPCRILATANVFSETFFLLALTLSHRLAVFSRWSVTLDAVP